MHKNDEKGWAKAHSFPFAAVYVKIIFWLKLKLFSIRFLHEGTIWKSMGRIEFKDR